VRRYDDDFAFVHLDDQSVFDLDLVPDTDPARNGAGCYMIVKNADGWHARLAAAGLAVTAVQDQPWDARIHAHRSERQPRANRHEHRRRETVIRTALGTQLCASA
jgi:hypothetical protein